MAAQPASINDRRFTRLSISTTTTTLTASTKAYATPPSSQTTPSSSSSSFVAPTLVDAFASLAVEVPRPQQQEVALQTAEHCSQNASQSAELSSVIVTRSTEHHSLTAAQSTQPRPQASTRSPRTNRRDDEKQQGSLKSGTKVPSDSVDRLVKRIGAVQIHQPSASTPSQTISPPVPATPANQKRSRSDYEEENSIEERLAKLYVGSQSPVTPTSASASASTSTPTITPLSTTTTTTTSMTTCDSTSHNRPAKTSSKSSERIESQLESYGSEVDMALHSLREARNLVVAALTCEPHRRYDMYTESEYAHTQYVVAHSHYLLRQLTDPARIEYQRMYEQAMGEYLQIYGQLKNEFRQKYEQAMIEFQRKRDKAWTEYQRNCDKAWIEYQRNRDKAWVEYQRNRGKARVEFQRNRDKECVEARRKYDKEWMESRRKYDKEWMQSRRKYDKERIESRRKYDKECKESQQKHRQVFEQSKKSTQYPRNKPAQQPRQISQSYHQTPPQYKQGHEKLVDKSSYPLLSKDAGAVPRSLPESVGDGSREDGDKTSEDHGRERKRIKHDDIKKEPVDGTMSDAATASTASTTTSTASTTSTFSTSSSHIVADVTLDIENKLNFNPITAISQ